MDVITVSALSKEYGSPSKPLKAVDSVSFRVEEGSVFGILGPNGAGKTTTMECMMGLRKRSSGEITILGLDPEKNRHKLFSRIGVQLQETVYQSGAKVYELCQLFSSMYRTPLDYLQLLERFGLAGKAKSYVGRLSGGQRQKLAIVLALLGNPEILFFDELTTGLDPGARRELWDYIKELKSEGRTIVMTTHYMEEAAVLCDKVCLINQGRIAAYDTVDGVIEQANIDLVISFETDQDVAALLGTLAHVTRVEQRGNGVNIFTTSEQTLAELVLVLRDRGISFRKIRITHPELEDAFLKLVGGQAKGAVS